MSIEDGDNIRFNTALILAAAADHELEAAKARRELAQLQLADYKADSAHARKGVRTE